MIGPIGSGKSTLAQRIHHQTGLPLYALDLLLFDEQGKVKNHKDVVPQVQQIQNSERWIIDGYGPYETILDRLERADEIVFLQTPLVLCWLLITLRWIKSLCGLPPRGQPRGLSVFNINNIKKSYLTLWKQHQVMNPQIKLWIQRKNWTEKVKYPKLLL